ncbi:holo-ACP synthase [Taylorella equigenitalis]|uniref:Holo-[acyl-carrier-protein] synthase n=1 Tax=Taylorella equigenitalis (strain MCE9) TaxID=937774 RepID=A0A654KIY2_TAYEM|nr:holo-ACP synthase [Taylorella equigenitalis]ADU92411.1 Holo-[acyl-carrier protein] synthase [Taylorella equigenitalis MCE9]ASY30600.1 holo-ACP synthase [Taylorella equigenitalis]ASY37907.1 holo-ACP synthase [Taylorella equigenitalis]ASY42327.1 holo-ACP synthase [Taylorella equigenitalis]KGK32925.1 ACP synthase [Taylorella equigenitalis]
MPLNRPYIAGIGTDLLHLARIQKAYDKFGLKFATRVLGLDELEVFQNRFERDQKRGIRYIATRFAAKEAFAKAIGLGIHSPMSWSRIQILNAKSGKTEIILNGPLKYWYEERFGHGHVSLTDESDIVMAFVVLERKD